MDVAMVSPAVLRGLHVTAMLVRSRERLLRWCIRCNIDMTLQEE
jgi:hypothetical protein